MNSTNNQRIAKNTLLLYFRMLLTMGVSLYTSRIVLNTLGVEDFGIYNVVGGVVVMFSFLNGAMASATQRFLSFEIGQNNFEELSRVFSMSVNIHAIIAFFIVLLAETVGLWFLNTHLTIPPERMIAANWIFQFSILAFAVQVFNVPFNAIIIAHERMNMFAWVSIAEVLLKLAVVFALGWATFDKLKFYAFLIFSVSLLISFIYMIYCLRNFSESKYHFFWNKKLFKTLMNYAAWNLWGNIAGVSFDQGVNILLNIFFGPAVNAARGIAYQVRAAINGFVSNFQLAMNPQIIKSFATGDIKYMHQLIFTGAKFSFFLLFILSLPVLLETRTILKIWLKIVPDYTVVFTRLIIINTLIDSISGPLMTAAQASGKIKVYQGIVGGLLILNLPISYLFLKFGFEPQVTLYISISISVFALLARLKIISPLVNLSKTGYLKNVILRIIPVSIFSFSILYAFMHFLQESFDRLIITVFLSFSVVLLSIYYIGMNKNEQVFLNGKLKQVTSKIIIHHG